MNSIQSKQFTACLERTIADVVAGLKNNPPYEDLIRGRSGILLFLANAYKYQPTPQLRTQILSVADDLKNYCRRVQPRDGTLITGRSGVIVSLVIAYQALEHLEIMEEISEIFDNQHRFLFNKYSDASFMDGVTGTVLANLLVANVRGRDTDISRLESSVNALIQKATFDEHGIYWMNNAHAGLSSSYDPIFILNSLASFFNAPALNELSIAAGISAASHYDKAKDKIRDLIRGELSAFNEQRGLEFCPYLESLALLGCTFDHLDTNYQAMGNKTRVKEIVDFLLDQIVLQNLSPPGNYWVYSLLVRIIAAPEFSNYREIILKYMEALLSETNSMCVADPLRGQLIVKLLSNEVSVWPKVSVLNRSDRSAYFTSERVFTCILRKSFHRTLALCLKQDLLSFASLDVKTPILGNLESAVARCTSDHDLLFFLKLEGAAFELKNKDVEHAREQLAQKMEAVTIFLNQPDEDLFQFRMTVDKGVLWFTHPDDAQRLDLRKELSVDTVEYLFHVYGERSYILFNTLDGVKEQKLGVFRILFELFESPLMLGEVVDLLIVFFTRQSHEVRTSITAMLWIEQGDNFEESIRDTIVTSIKNYVSLGIIAPIV